MLTNQRQQIIRAQIETLGQVVSGDLAAMLQVSEDTIRRDLRSLAKQGKCRRVYGGAVAPYAGPLAARVAHHPQDKAALARKAVTLILPGQTVFVDAGSTTAAIARAIPDGIALTVVTNALDVAQTLAACPAIKLVLLGGQLNRETGAFAGPDMARTIAGIAADVAFLGSCGVDTDVGITAFGQEDAKIKQAMATSARRVVIAATADKIGTRASYRVVGPKDISDLIVPTAVAKDSLIGFDPSTTVHRA